MKWKINEESGRKEGSSEDNKKKKNEVAKPCDVRKGRLENGQWGEGGGNEEEENMEVPDGI